MHTIGEQHQMQNYIQIELNLSAFTYWLFHRTDSGSQMHAMRNDRKGFILHER